LWREGLVLSDQFGLGCIAAIPPEFGPEIFDIPLDRAHCRIIINVSINSFISIVRGCVQVASGLGIRVVEDAGPESEQRMGAIG
jgi:hypothetical protein